VKDKMSKIRIKNFGPVKEGYQDNEGWLDVKKVTLFIGNQGSGKSTVAKLISTFTWIEKVLVRGDYEQKWFESNGKIKKSYFPYHRIENYDPENLAEIEYYGDAYHFKYEKGNFVVEKIENENFPLPQIMYVPAERNFLTYVRSPKKLEVSSRSLLEFATEYINAEDNLKSTTVLPINNVEIEYNKRHDMLYLKGKDYKIKITEASSGFQSFVPLYLVSDYLAKSIKGRSENYELSPEDQEKFRKNADAITADISLTD
jgi:energy-coupling factor transporter ATP-binding protein EcfA2